MFSCRKGHPDNIRVAVGERGQWLKEAYPKAYENLPKKILNQDEWMDFWLELSKTINEDIELMVLGDGLLFENKELYLCDLIGAQEQ